MAERRYTKSHEWLTVEGKHATVGHHRFRAVSAG